MSSNIQIAAWEVNENISIIPLIYATTLLQYEQRPDGQYSLHNKGFVDIPKRQLIFEHPEGAEMPEGWSIKTRQPAAWIVQDGKAIPCSYGYHRARFINDSFIQLAHEPLTTRESDLPQGIPYSLTKVPGPEINKYEQFLGSDRWKYVIPCNTLSITRRLYIDWNQSRTFAELLLMSDYINRIPDKIKSQYIYADPTLATVTSDLFTAIQYIEDLCKQHLSINWVELL